MRDLLILASALTEKPFIIECICDDAVARNRLEHERTLGRHLAGNRTYDLYLDVKARAEPITIPHLVLDTGRLPLEDCVSRCLAYLRSERSSPGSST